MNPNILLIEDDPDIRELVSVNLEDINYSVDTADDGTKGLRLATEKDYALIVLDLMLPGLNGLEICRRLRAAEDFTPILMLTSLDSETDRVVGLEVGADDYLVKPFSIRELQARVRAVLRRVEQLSRSQERNTAEAVCTSGDLSIDASRREVTLAGERIELTQTEFDLLSTLATHPGKVFSRGELLDQVWGYSHSGYEHTVNSHINRLRNKIERDPSEPEYILTVWGVGYRFRDLAE